MPENVLCKDYISYIKSKTEIMFTNQEVAEIIEAIKIGRLPKTWVTRRQHIKSLNDRHQ